MLIEGAEETGSDDVGEWVRDDARGADAVIVFDSGMVDAETPALTLATRGMVFAHLEVRTGTQTAHSGMYGGAALNAFHALHQALAAVLAGPDGRLPEPLRAGVHPPSPAEIESWKTLPSGESELAGVGARPADAAAATEFYVRTTAEPSLDVHRVEGGAGAHDRRPRRVGRPERADRRRPAHRRDRPQPRAAPARRAARRRRADLQRRPRRAVGLRPRAPALQAARRAIEKATGREPALVRTGGTLPSWPRSPSAASPRSSPASACPTTRCTRPTSPTGSSPSSRARATARALYEELAGLR